MDPGSAHPRFAPHGAPCPGCGAPLAADQRHCLKCGARRAPPRVDFMSLLRVGEEPRRAGPAEGPAAAPPPERFSPAALGSAALALILAGVAIGVSGNGPSADSLAAAARRVVVMTGSPTPVGNPLATDAGSADTGASTTADTGSTPDTVSSAPAAPASDTGAAPTATEPSAPLDTSTPTGSTPTTSTPAPATKPSIGHVFVLMLAGRGEAATFGPSAPAGYLRDELPKLGALLSGYRAISAAPTADRIALIGGQAPNPQTEADCPTFSEFAATGPPQDGQAQGEGCLYPGDFKSVADQLGTVGYDWRGYFGGMEAPCKHPAPGAPDGTATTGPYAVAHDPFVHFHTIVDGADCERSVLPLDRLTPDLRVAKSTPRLAFVAPDRCAGGFQAPCADGTPGGPAAVDAFLRRWVPAILHAPAYKADGLLVVAFDRGPDAAQPVGALALSPFVKPGRRSAKPYDHYSLLRTIEDRLGLDGHLGQARKAAVHPFGDDVFDRQLAPLPAPQGGPS
jgi:hypothetical protein